MNMNGRRDPGPHRRRAAAAPEEQPRLVPLRVGMGRARLGVSARPRACAHRSPGHGLRLTRLDAARMQGELKSLCAVFIAACTELTTVDMLS